ncbi:HNH endonuclease [Myroides ceti]|uniref:HNH endonuclease n=1 Tax=Paenimyroides ceti TaxID=395087 RepID=A0ABT8D1I2_9FLAO|nr:HNH endonuclease [Paenimyroides ceti]MDN3706525.1 HNH endonuclease [Paenimyroides ceti]MDN3710324.1 HNH endonuclease [Paenimyroides ceti]MDN3710359.1 HNH endonuclease [Paenimyroides ceti]
MIKLDRTPKPVELTAELQVALTDEFKSTGKSVWNVDFIKKGLLGFSNDKCCYCEANINEESKYLEVEHFNHKDTYKDEVLEWENLLPSCKKCNGTKNDHDTKLEPIIDPSKIDPKNHLKYWRYRIKGSDEFGKLTVSVLKLNDQDRLVKKRFEIGNAIQEKLEQLNELTDDYISGVQTSTRRKNRVVNGTKDLMKEGLPTAIYSATSAAVILTDTEFEALKSKLTSLGFWDAELAQLEIELNKTALKLEK